MLKKILILYSCYNGKLLGNNLANTSSHAMWIINVYPVHQGTEEIDN